MTNNWEIFHDNRAANDDRTENLFDFRKLHEVEDNFDDLMFPGAIKSEIE